MRAGSSIVLGLFAIAAVACTEPKSADFGTAAEGEACAQPSDCIAGLTCENAKCAKLGPLTEGPQPGDPCTSDSTCAPSLRCGRQGVCTTLQLGGSGAQCAFTEDCAAPLVCNGMSGTCVAADGTAGTLDEGGTCAEILDCRRPFVCGITGKCERLPIYLGPDCTLSDDEAGAFRVYWELPPEGELPAKYEWDRHPFPSDVRMVDGHPSLRGHPAPENVLGVSMRDTYFATVESDVNGFAPNEPLFFRFSDVLDVKSVCLDPGGKYPESGGFCASGGAASVFLVNVDEDSPGYGERVPVQLATGREAGTYICQNWLGLVSLDGRPLRQGTTYAAVITTDVRNAAGEAPIADRDFAQILSGEKQVAAMAPLLAWIADKGVDKATIAAASVFTVGTFESKAAKIREAVHRLAAPTFGTHVTCGGAAVSPCAAAAGPHSTARGCVTNGGAAFDVVEGTYAAPAFQQGTRPFKQASQGGGFVFGTDGVPVPQGTETMCFAAALPKTPAPADGFPVVIVGHGTGGSFESALLDGTAERFTALGYAVIGFDNVMHGPRQQPAGATPDPTKWVDPGNVFFNLANPRASRDNILQGSADLFQLVRLVRNPAATLNGPHGPVKFKPSRVAYFGHSQGTVIAPAFLAAEPDLAGAVLSGSGGDLALSLLNKKTPIDSAAAAGIFFGDRNLTRIHPIMGVLAMLFADSDALAYAHRWTKEPAIRGAPLPLLHVLGIGDNYTPDATQHAQLRASGLPLVGSVEVSIEGVEAIGSPARNNLNGVTAGAVQLRPDGAYDGHFVSFNHPKGKAAVTHFLDGVKAGAPEIAK